MIRKLQSFCKQNPSQPTTLHTTTEYNHPGVSLPNYFLSVSKKTDREIIIIYQVYKFMFLKNLKIQLRDNFRFNFFKLFINASF